MLVYNCKYKEIVYLMYLYFDMNAVSEVRYLQGSHITRRDLVKWKALILISYKGLSGESCRQTHTNSSMRYEPLLVSVQTTIGMWCIPVVLRGESNSASRMKQ